MATMSLPFCLHRPTAWLFAVNNVRPSKPTWVRFVCRRRLSFGGFDPFTGRKGVSDQSKMAKVSAFTGGSGGSSRGDEGIKAFEQEALVGGGGGSHSGIGLMADGLESTLNGLSKWLMAGLVGAYVLLKHDAESLWAIMGSLINSTLSVILKRILNQERPFSHMRSDPGMPSSHAQSIFFIVVYGVLSIFAWLGVNLLSVALGVMLLAMGGYFSWLRVSQQLHTISQVGVGAVLGSVVSGLWYWAWIDLVAEAFSSLLWVRIIVILGAVGFTIGFILHVIRHWFER